MTSLRSILSAIALFLTAVPACNKTEDPELVPLITEFVARNQMGAKDEDGDASDWIELYNPHPQVINLGGQHLTDDKSNPTRWAFPEGLTLEPGAYLVVFASGKNRLVLGKPLHTNFSLSGGDVGSCARGTGGGGEYLAVTTRGGATAAPEWNPYPAQFSDVSYGLMGESTDAMSAYFARPTPGAKNDNTSALAERVTFNPPSSAFTMGAPQAVNLSVTSKTATIRYTTTRARPIGVAGITGNFMADAMTDVYTLPNHGFSEGDLVRTSGPAPLVQRVNYFVKVIDANNIKLAIEPGGPPIDLTAGGMFEIRRDAATGTAATSDVITTTAEHGFYSGDPVQVSSTGMLPAGLAAATTYYVVLNSATSFRLSTSPTLMPIVDITAAGAGMLTIARTPSPTYAGPIPLTVNTRIRARAYEAGRPDGPIGSEMYLAIDAAAQMFTSTLPIVVTHTWNTGMPNDVRVDSHIMIFEPKLPDNLARLTNPADLVAPCTLERRGSSTAGDPKFSMAVELQDENGIDQECQPFGMPENADWVMHAPYQFDRSMMHNDLVYRLSNEVGRYAVRTKFIEHIHNEQSMTDTIEGAITGTDYFGVYSFMEKITRAKDRIDVENLTIADNALPDIQGGYMFKADRLDTGETGIRPLTGQSFGGVGNGGPGDNILAWVNPRELSLDPFKRVTMMQSDWLRGHLGEAWAALNGPNYTDPANGYAKYWDVAAMVDHHILNVATKNPDAFRLSSYWYKPRFGKITAGPIWDFDRAEGSTDGRDFDWSTWTGSGGTDFFNYPWYREMFRDPNFWQVWIDRLEAMRQGALATSNINARIDELAAQLNPGDAMNTPAKRSVMRWGASAPRGTGSNTAITNNTFNGQYTGEIAWLKYWWQQRLAFMDSQVTRPAVANLPQGTVPAGTTVTLSSPSQSMPGVKIYYTTNGTDPRGAQPGPMLAPNAVEYTAPIAINGPTQLFVRAYNPTPAPLVGSGWSAPTTLAYSP